MTDDEDFIAQAFERVRREAQRRNGRVPDLNNKDAFRRTTPRTAGERGNGGSGVGDKRRRGRPTGPDGRYKPYVRSAEPLGSILNREIRSRGWGRDIAAGWVTSHWAELVGPKIAQHTKVEMIKDKKLFITCDSTAWATNLRMMQKQILQVIAEKVGPDIIAELRIYGPQAPSWRKGPLHVKGRGPRDTYG
ncbi:DUF721 domain-containing protein [Corynebacterium gallinarum]|uniref:UPF0232 protein H9627_05315 n=1 Tax=Corynebacterium gallinarum TaxID=2762214 RepID=A0A8I0LH08_9CORY|nr:DUF721 domain-containing protein [Corynebacterium gallinarum]MBD8029750.1 DUF721 domain-containing protein [Corynebacterium gallinarum]